MKCPGCGWLNPEGVRFCGRCATEFTVVCTRCGFDNPVTFDFCGRCAASLADTARGPAVGPVPAGAVRDLVGKILDPSLRIDGERRNVTVLFVDLSAFTPLAERMDPEEVYIAVDLYLRALVEEIQQYGGYVDKFTGDGLMALFGAPTTHEDDPERAVRAALGIQRRLGQMAETNAWAAPVALRARIGINTGTVVVGRLGAGEGADYTYTAMGDVVNVAARLEKVAEPGEILASASTHAVTQGFFRFEEMGPVFVRGRQEPVETYRVVAGMPRTAARGSRSLQAPFVGREAELGMLRGVMERLMRQQQGGMVLITGEAGVGKTRLTAEVRASLLPQTVTFLVGDTVTYGRRISYKVVVALLRHFFDVEDGEPADKSLQKVRKRLRAMGVTVGDVAQPFLENLMGLPLSAAAARRLLRLDPQQLRQQTFLAVRRLLAAAAAERPLVLVFENLHWIDELSLELLLFVLNSVESAPILLYVTSRSGNVAADRLDEAARKRLADSYYRLELQPLPPADNLSLVHALLSLPGLPESVRDLILSKAEGNPFFVEELIGVLIDQGVFQEVDEQWQVRPEVDLAHIDVPATLDRLIMARVDSLGPRARRVLQCASVIGQQFSVALLQPLLDEPQVELEALLLLLEERGFIRLLPGEGQKGFAFRQGLTRDSVYNSLLFRRRRQLHRQIADTIERDAPNQAAAEPELVAHHYWRSDMADHALPYLIAAGHRAQGRFANKEAIGFYEQALQVLDNLDSPAAAADRVEVYTYLGEARALVGQYSAAATAYEAALAAASQEKGAADPEVIANIYRLLAQVEERRGNYAEAHRWLEAALNILDQASVADSAVSRARVSSDLGWLYYRQGHYDEALAQMRRALPSLERSEFTSELASAYNRLGAVVYNRGDYSEALEYGERGLKLHQEVGDTQGMSRSYNNLAGLAFFLGDWDRATEYLTRGLELSEKASYTEGVVSAHLNLATIYQWRGDLGVARAQLVQAAEVARVIANTRQIAFAMFQLGELSIREGDLDVALSYLEESRRVSQDAGAQEVLAEAEWRMAWAYLEQGDFQGAAQWVEKAIRLSEEIGYNEALGDALRIDGVLRRSGGLLEQAETSLQASIHVFQTLGNKLKTAKGELELGHLYQQWARVRPGFTPRKTQAETLYRSALTVFRSLGAEPDYRQAERALAAVQSGSPHLGGAAYV